MGSNITKVYLLNVPIEADYKHTLYFDNASSQQSYFQSKVVGTLQFNNFSYQRKDNIIRVPREIDSLYNVNYVMYQNSNYSNKWFYAFVKDMEYISDGRTDLHIETDVIQTWLFDYSFKTSFIEREHVNNDTVGLHTIPEDLEHGEYICNQHVIDDTMDNISTELVYILSCSVDLGEYVNDPTSYNSDNPIPPSPIRKYNGIISGTSYYPALAQNTIKAFLDGLTRCGQIDAVNGLFMAPAICVGTLQNDYSIEEKNTPYTYTNTILKQTTLNGYTPRNKKLLTREYNYLLVSNNNGTSSVMNYEDFTNSCTFKIDLSVTPGCSIRMIPTNYKGVAENDEYGINMGKLPICSYPVDMYTNWLTQNSINVGGMTITSDDINVGSSVFNGILSSVSSVATGNYLSTANSVGNGLANIGNAMITKKQHQLIPPEARGNLNSGDVITSSGKNNFHFYKMSIKQEYAKIIDSYFDMYGYKVNEVKIPNSNHRENYWFTKTIDCNIVGNLPQNDILKIKSIYNNGITFWKNASNIKNYNVSNNIV